MASRSRRGGGSGSGGRGGGGGGSIIAQQMQRRRLRPRSQLHPHRHARGSLHEDPRSSVTSSHAPTRHRHRLIASSRRVPPVDTQRRHGSRRPGHHHDGGGGGSGGRDRDRGRGRRSERVGGTTTVVPPPSGPPPPNVRRRGGGGGGGGGGGRSASPVPSHTGMAGPPTGAGAGAGARAGSVSSGSGSGSGFGSGSGSVSGSSSHSHGPTPPPRDGGIMAQFLPRSSRHGYQHEHEHEHEHVATGATGHSSRRGRHSTRGAPHPDDDNASWSGSVSGSASGDDEVASMSGSSERGSGARSALAHRPQEGTPAPPNSNHSNPNHHNNHILAGAHKNNTAADSKANTATNADTSGADAADAADAAHAARAHDAGAATAPPATAPPATAHGTAAARDRRVPQRRLRVNSAGSHHHPHHHQHHHHRRRGQQQPHSASPSVPPPPSPGGSVQSAMTMNEAEVQARLEQIHAASARQFQSMRELHVQELERSTAALHAEHAAAVAKLRAEWEAHHVREVAEAEAVAKAAAKKRHASELAKAMVRARTAEQRLAAAEATHGKAVAKLQAQVQEERDALAAAREAWAQEKQKLLQDAETGWVGLYSDITTNAETLVNGMRQQMQEAVARANRDSAAAAERSLQQEKEAAAAREVFESKLTRECEVLITQYKDMAQRAMRKAAEAQEAARLEIMSKLQEQQEGRRKWEAELQSRTTQAVQAANERALAAQRELEAERQRFSVLEAQVKAQFNQHCRQFEAQLRSKAVNTLHAYKMTLQQRDAFLPPPRQLQVGPMSARGHHDGTPPRQSQQQLQGRLRLTHGTRDHTTTDDDDPALSMSPPSASSTSHQPRPDAGRCDTSRHGQSHRSRSRGHGHGRRRPTANSNNSSSNNSSSNNSSSGQRYYGGGSSKEAQPGEVPRSTSHSSRSPSPSDLPVGGAEDGVTTLRTSRHHRDHHPRPQQHRLGRDGLAHHPRDEDDSEQQRASPVSFSSPRSHRSRNSHSDGDGGAGGAGGAGDAGDAGDGGARDDSGVGSAGGARSGGGGDGGSDRGSSSRHGQPSPFESVSGLGVHSTDNDSMTGRVQAVSSGFSDRPSVDEQPGDEDDAMSFPALDAPQQGRRQQQQQQQLPRSRQQQLHAATVSARARSESSPAPLTDAMKAFQLAQQAVSDATSPTGHHHPRPSHSSHTPTSHPEQRQPQPRQHRHPGHEPSERQRQQPRQQQRQQPRQQQRQRHATPEPRRSDDVGEWGAATEQSTASTSHDKPRRVPNASVQSARLLESRLGARRTGGTSTTREKERSTPSFDVTTPSGLSAYIESLRARSSRGAGAGESNRQSHSSTVLESARQASQRTERFLATPSSSAAASSSANPGVASVVEPASSRGPDLLQQYKQAYAAVKSQSRGPSSEPLATLRRGTSVPSSRSDSTPMTSNGGEASHPPYFSDATPHSILPVSPALPSTVTATSAAAAANSVLPSPVYARGLPNRPAPPPPPVPLPQDDGRRASTGAEPAAPSVPAAQAASRPSRVEAGAEEAPSPSPRGVGVGAAAVSNEADDDTLAAVVAMMSEEDRQAWDMLQRMY